MSASKDKGTAAESALVGYLRSHGFTGAERLALQGANDRGDVSGVPSWVIEVKSQKRYDFPGWLRELAVEVENADKSDTNTIPYSGVLIVKPNGVGLTRVGDWWAIMPVHEWLDLA
jgi:hypothetical protein